MINNPVPTRAEVSDVCNAVWDGADVAWLHSGAPRGSRIRLKDILYRQWGVALLSFNMFQQWKYKKMIQNWMMYSVLRHFIILFIHGIDACREWTLWCNPESRASRKQPMWERTWSFLVFVNATTGWFYPLQNLAAVEWWYVLGDFLLNAGRHSQMLFLQFFFGEKRQGP